MSEEAWGQSRTTSKEAPDAYAAFASFPHLVPALLMLLGRGDEVTDSAGELLLRLRIRRGIFIIANPIYPCERHPEEQSTQHMSNTVSAPVFQSRKDDSILQLQYFWTYLARHVYLYIQYTIHLFLCAGYFFNAFD